MVRARIPTLVLGAALLVTLGCSESGADQPLPDDPVVGAPLSAPLVDATEVHRASSDGSGVGSGVAGKSVDRTRRVDATGAEAIEAPERSAAEAETRPKLPAGVKEVTFSELAGFDYPTSTPGMPGVEGMDLSALIPPAIRDLDGKRVAVTGFMIPWKFEKGKIEVFFLSRKIFDCCFGDVAAVNEVIEVTMKEGVGNLSFRPIVVTGTLEVGEVKDDYGYVMSIYRLAGESVILESHL